MKEETIELLKELTECEGVSSDEKTFSEYLKKVLESYCEKTSIDSFGNVYGEIKSSNNSAYTILLEAHLDRVGLMITNILDDGCLKFTNVGGIDERILPYSRVKIYGKKKIDGVICPINQINDEIKIENLKIDIGYIKNEAEDIVKIGNKAIVVSDFKELLNNKLSSPCLDNRAGILTVLNAIKNIDREKLKYNLKILFTVGEELGFHGAYNAKINDVDIAIVIDVTHGETLDTKNETGVFPLGTGAVICRGPNIDYKLSKDLIELADKYKINYDIEVCNTSTGTTAWAIQTRGKGIPTLLISIPLRYMHTNVETIDLSDIDAISELIQKTIEGGLNI